MWVLASLGNAVLCRDAILFTVLTTARLTHHFICGGRGSLRSQISLVHVALMNNGDGTHSLQLKCLPMESKLSYPGPLLTRHLIDLQIRKTTKILPPDSAKKHVFSLIRICLALYCSSICNLGRDVLVCVSVAFWMHVV
jgi:hypothetical protein